MEKGFRHRAALVLLLLTFGFAALGVKLYFLQVAGPGKAEEMARRQLERTLPFRPKRGVILDRNGRELAVSVDAPSLYAHPPALGDPEGAAGALAPILEMSPAALRKKLSAEKPYVWVARKLRPAQREAVEKLGLEGMGFAAESRRFYPKGELASHLMGFVGVDDQGLEGLEYRYDRLMRGKPGWIRVELDALGRPLYGGPRPPVQGYDLQLNIDEVIQYIAQKELAARVEATGARGGVAILMDPRDGSVLAMAVAPPYNPNRFSSYKPEQWRDRAVTDLYEPGSTFKFVVASAFLERGLGGLEERFFAEEGVMPLGGRLIHDHKPFGWLTLREVIEKSSNIGAIKISQRLGPELLYRFIRRFGFGSPTGIDLPGEAAGIVRPPERWSALSIGSLAIGQEVSVTPIQLIAAFSALANGGLLMKPWVVRAVMRHGEVVKEFGPEAVRRVLSPSTCRLMSEVLRGVVERGTGVKAALEGYSVAGKTGTAQKPDPESGGYSKTKYLSSFIGYVPAEHPAFVALVMVDEPKGAPWGGEVAAPAFRRIARQVLRYLRVPASGDKVLFAKAPRRAPVNEGSHSAESVLSLLFRPARMLGSAIWRESAAVLGYGG